MSRQPDIATRLRRLLAILAWLAQVEEASIDEAATRFSLSPDELVTELEKAACCGVPPYTPDQLMEIVVTEDSVSVRPGTTLARPRRLSPHEGFVLAASVRALLAVPGSDEDGALSGALEKLERALGGQELFIDLDEPQHLAAVRRALDDGKALVIAYYSASTDQISDRLVLPQRLFASEGHWYLDAWCSTAGGVRRFRVDRISVAEPISFEGDAPESTPTDEPQDVFVPGPDSQRVRLSVGGAATWMVEHIPSAGAVEEVGDGVEFDVFVGGSAWLERLLLRLGPDAQVVAPDEFRTLAAEAAQRILERYTPL